MLCGIASMTSAQFGGRFSGGRGGGGRDGEYVAGNEPITPLPEDRKGVPNWQLDPNFKRDAFTFVRLRFTNIGYRGGSDGFANGFGGGGFNGGYGRGSPGGGRGMRGTGTSWKNDWPDSDLDFSFRLQQLTSLKVNPEPIQLEITDERLFDYPFVYMIQVGRLEFTEDEVRILRHYLLNGGFLMVDDHWGPDQQNWYDQIKRVFPDREPVELQADHPIFHCVFDLPHKPQVPAIQRWYRWQQTGEPDRTAYFLDDPEPHYRAIYDGKGRMMVLECANTDLGDGWEREGDNVEFFRKFSETQAYPIGINIVVYAMTH